MSPHWKTFPLSHRQFEAALMRVEPQLKNLPEAIRVECMERTLANMGLARKGKRRPGALLVISGGASLIGSGILLAMSLVNLTVLRGSAGVAVPLVLAVAVVACVIVTSPAMLTLLFLRKRFRRAVWTELNSLGYPACLECGYLLQGQDRARCPECGAISFDMIRKVGIGGLGLQE